ncbi:hypothetical protein BBP40_009658 [Aspergillus hancockii]|nr:hypothetical protein BBP40_009658 [Aspergillus hancockii]
MFLKADIKNIRTGVAAVNSTNHLRFYFQDTHGHIRESFYEGKCANGTDKNVVADAKLGSPIAATSKELNHYPVAPYSRLLAVFLAGTNALHLRIYAQKSNNTIQEYMWNDLKVIQRAYEPHPGWYKKLHPIFDKTLPGTAIAATSFGVTSNGIFLQIYFVNFDNTIWQVCWDHGKEYWDKSTITPVIQGSEVAVISWGSFPTGGPDLRLYFQNGTYVSAVSEWVWTSAHGAQLGQGALSPA